MIATVAHPKAVPGDTRSIVCASVISVYCPGDQSDQLKKFLLIFCLEDFRSRLSRRPDTEFLKFETQAGLPEVGSWTGHPQSK